MKLLFDKNPSFKLVARLDEIYPGSIHVDLVGLSRATDAEIWAYATRNNFIIVSKDDDFRQMSMLRGAPPKVVRLQLGN